MIFLFEPDLVWSELLRQEGVNFTADERSGDRAVVILNRRPGIRQARSVRQRVEAGGGLLVSGDEAAATWLGTGLARKRLRWIAPEGDSLLFRNVGIVDTDTRGTRLPGAGIGITDSGAKAILAGSTSRGFCVILPLDVGKVLSSVGSGPKQFYADAPRLPYDTVARTDRGEVRRLVANCLRLLAEQQGLPYVRLASVPGQARSALAFRVDTDFGPRKDLEAVARLAGRVGMKFSWFVNVGAHGEHLDLFADLARNGHDIQLHCLRHTVYPDYERNLENFRTAQQAMTDAGIKPCGAVAPFGEWNPNLNRALEELGFEYSSEFCLAYDDLPFRPVVNGQLSKVLQVPVHPICLGRLVAARASEKQMAAYSRAVVERQVSRQEPCILYDHPERIAQFSDLLADVLHYGKERCGAAVTMTDYARWWQRRERLTWNATISGNVLQVTADKNDSALSLVAEQGGRSAKLPACSGDYRLTDLNWQPLPDPVPFNPKALLSRKPSLLLRARSVNRRVRKNLQGRRG